MNKRQAKELIDKYLNGTATPEEQALFELLANRVTKKRLENIGPDDYTDLREQLYKRLPQATRSTVFKRYRWLAAASLIICVSAAALIFYPRNYQKTEQVSAIVPGGNQAILTLANGKKITLTTAGDGKLAEQAGISISKTHNGQLIYRVAATNPHAAVGYNTTETPKGGQYQLQLADGTKVWLNASSSLKYPTRFEGSERNVELTGEAYFEVAHNVAMPFKVKTSKQVVTVLGTHFNINAYGDEPLLKTTLLEGKVRINALGCTASAILKPGQQASLRGSDLSITTGDTEEVVAWKNGYFRFRNEPIQSVMRKLSRWYNIDVQYTANVSNEGYYGTVSRYKNINQILTVLAETGSVHFKIEGRSVIVMK